GIELGTRIEQRRITADASIQAVRVVLVVLAGERTFGVLVARHVVGGTRELSAPLLIALHDPSHFRDTLPRTRHIERFDRDRGALLGRGQSARRRATERARRHAQRKASTY